MKAARRHLGTIPKMTYADGAFYKKGACQKRAFSGGTMKRAILIGMALLAPGAASAEIYKCTVNGKETITNIPCDEKPRRKEEKPKYEEIVECGLQDGMERQLAILISGNAGKRKDCSAPKREK